MYLVVEGLEKTMVKPLNYSQVTAVQQGPDESPSVFLQRLQNAIPKHTTVDPESQVGEVFFKDKFLTQLKMTSVENIKRWPLKEEDLWNNWCSLPP
jgi:hypothetical protein